MKLRVNLVQQNLRSSAAGNNTRTARTIPTRLLPLAAGLRSAWWRSIRREQIYMRPLESRDNYLDTHRTLRHGDGPRGRLEVLIQ